MNHLYANDEGEVVAAKSAKEAGEHYDCELGGYDAPQSLWEKIEDCEEITVEDIHDTGQAITKTAGEWANEFETPVVIATTYI